MKKISIVIISILFAALNMQAQENADIQKIKSRYQEIKKAIAFSKKNKFEGSVYCDVLERNVNHASWPALGNFFLREELWYSEQPDFLDNPKSGLVMVIAKGEQSVEKYYSEYLFDNGKLVFVYYKNNTDELRYYFKNNNLINQLGNASNNVYTITPRAALQNADIYLHQYLATFYYKSN